MVNEQRDKPRLQLSGANGNAFMVIGLARTAAKRAGWSQERIEALQSDMFSADYNHLLQVALEHFEVS
jgi:hypothetical protein